MRLFEDEISDVIATDGPCEILWVGERTEQVIGGGFAARVEKRTFGVVAFRAKARIFPRQDASTGEWRLPESTTETRLLILEPSLRGVELPPDTGRFLGSFRHGERRYYAFLARPSRAAERPAAPEGQKGGPSPARAPGGGQNPAPSGKVPPAAPPSGGQRPTPHRSEQSGGPL